MGVRVVKVTFFDVSNGEIEPLRVIQGIEIEVEVQIVLEFMYFLDFS